MRIFIIDTLYSGLLNRLEYFNRPLDGQEFHDLNDFLCQQKFSSGPAYLAEFHRAGHTAAVVFANSPRSQLSMNHITRSLPLVLPSWRHWQLLSRIPILGRDLHNRSTKVKILLQQIKDFEPDVIYCLDINFLNKQLLKQIKQSVRLVVGQIASPLPPKSFYLGYDHIFSAHPKQVEHFKNLGVNSSWLPLAFDKDHTREFEENGWPARNRDVTFVGTFGRHQKNTKAIMKAVGHLNPTLEIYTVTPESKLRRWGLAKYYRGPAWGEKMRKVFAESKVVVNRHGPVAAGYAVNNRLFEATGMGAILVTEEAKNLGDLFEPGREVLTYFSATDAARTIHSILKNYSPDNLVGLAGQARTWADHTHASRVKVIEKTLKQLLSKTETDTK